MYQNNHQQTIDLLQADYQKYLNIIDRGLVIVDKTGRIGFPATRVNGVTELEEIVPKSTADTYVLLGYNIRSVTEEDRAKHKWELDEDERWEDYVLVYIRNPSVIHTMHKLRALVERNGDVTVLGTSLQDSKLSRWLFIGYLFEDNVDLRKFRKDSLRWYIIDNTLHVCLKRDGETTHVSNFRLVDYTINEVRS